jgi:pyruvate kinase
MRRTKILATIGPASATAVVLDGMVRAGLDAVRLNFSHGTHDAHAKAYRLVRDAAHRAGRPIAVLQDVQGPKIRLGRVKAPGLEVPTGSTLVITTRDVEGEGGVVPTTYAALPGDVSPGQRILFDEGRLEVVVREVRGQDIVCDVTDGGVLASNKGICVPGAMLTTAAMTEKDRADVRFALGLGVDLVALSFVRAAEDVLALRALMREVGRVVPIIAKIEKPQGVENLDAILDVADGVMVARGDLAIEVSLEMVPILQKKIVHRANERGKLAITATQMLESMTDNPLPTRAEVTDVANAVLDGTDAVMLSGETAVGRFPVETVARMSAIATAAEEHAYVFDRPRPWTDPGDLGAALARLAGHAARELRPAAVVVFDDAALVKLLSDERPRAPIVFFTGDEAARGHLALFWGVVPRRRGSETDTVEEALRDLVREGLLAPGDRVVVVRDRRAPDAVRVVELPDA